MSAALEIQTELEAERAAVGPVDTAYTGYGHMDFRHSERDGRNGQHRQNENRK